MVQQGVHQFVLGPCHQTLAVQTQLYAHLMQVHARHAQQRLRDLIDLFGRNVFPVQPLQGVDGSPVLFFPFLGEPRHALLRLFLPLLRLLRLLLGLLPLFALRGLLRLLLLPSLLRGLFLSPSRARLAHLIAMLPRVGFVPVRDGFAMLAGALGPAGFPRIPQRPVHLAVLPLDPAQLRSHRFQGGGIGGRRRGLRVATILQRSGKQLPHVHLLRFGRALDHFGEVVNHRVRVRTQDGFEEEFAGRLNAIAHGFTPSLRRA